MDQGDNKAAGKQRRWGRWIGFSILGFVALMIGGHGFWGWWQEKKLGQEIAALRAKGEPMLAEELMNSPVADEDNAAILLRQAAALIDEKDEAWKQFDQLELALPLSEKEIALVRPIVESHQGALAKMRAARGKKGVDWKIDLSGGILLLNLPDLTRQKYLARLAHAAALFEHQRGNDREAVELMKDMLAQSAAVERLPAGLVPHLVAIGTGAMTCEVVDQVVPDLKIGTKEGEVAPADVKKLIEILLNESSAREGQRDALRVERAAEVQAAMSLESLAQMTNQKEQRGLSFGSYVMRPLFLKDGRIMVRHTTEIIDKGAEAKDWPEFKAKAKDTVGQMGALKVKSAHMLAAILMPSLDTVVERTFRGITQRRLSAAGLAMRWYWVENGKWPGSLEELTPKYLPHVPNDPMAAQKKIGYVAQEPRPRIYSVGADGKDDGGSDKPLRKNFKGKWIEEDVVVDLKRQARVREEE